MKPLRPSRAFRKDLKRIARRGYDLTRLRAIVERLQRDEPLSPVNRPHALKGEWLGYSECHVRPDWLLIYRTTESEVRLARTGTHADLFNG